MFKNYRNYLPFVVLVLSWGILQLEFLFENCMELYYILFFCLMLLAVPISGFAVIIWNYCKLNASEMCKGSMLASILQIIPVLISSFFAIDDIGRSISMGYSLLLLILYGALIVFLKMKADGKEIAD